MGQPRVTSIAVVTPTTFITGDHDHLIQLWSFRREGERPVIAKSERLSVGHTSAIRTIAMGRDNVLWSAAGRSLLGTDIRYSRTVVPLTRKANYIINQIHFNEGELLLEVFCLVPLSPCVPTLCRRRTWIIPSDYMTQGPPSITIQHYLVLPSE